MSVFSARIFPIISASRESPLRPAIALLPTICCGRTRLFKKGRETSRPSGDFRFAREGSPSPNGLPGRKCLSPRCGRGAGVARTPRSDARTRPETALLEVPRRPRARRPRRAAAGRGAGHARRPAEAGRVVGGARRGVRGGRVVGGLPKNPTGARRLTRGAARGLPSALPAVGKVIEQEKPD